MLSAMPIHPWSHENEHLLMQLGDYKQTGERVRNIDCDALIIHGDGDMLVSRMNVVELTERIKMGMLLNLPFAGHSAHEDQPEIFLWAFNEFMKPKQSSVNS